MTVLVPFGVGPQSELLARIAPGILWLGALLACLLSLDRLLALDWEDGTLDLLATSPLPLAAISTFFTASRRPATHTRARLLPPWAVHSFRLSVSLVS